jgi:hypothetical protein
VKGGDVIDYPWVKLQVNRFANTFLRLLFNISLNDVTNAFKAYRRMVIEGCQPLISPHFSLTVEIPLKAIVRTRKNISKMSAQTKSLPGTRFMATLKGLSELL